MKKGLLFIFLCAVAVFCQRSIWTSERVEVSQEQLSEMFSDGQKERDVLREIPSSAAEQGSLLNKQATAEIYGAYRAYRMPTSRTSRLGSVCIKFQSNHYNQPLFFLLLSERLCDVLPKGLVVSAANYIIALRHIIR